MCIETTYGVSHTKERQQGDISLLRPNVCAIPKNDRKVVSYQTSSVIQYVFQYDVTGPEFTTN